MFYEKFSAACKRAGVSPTAAAASAKISASVVTGWKQGSEPTLGTACKAAEALGLSLDELLGVSSKNRKKIGCAVSDLEILLALRSLSPEKQAHVIKLMEKLVFYQSKGKRKEDTQDE